MKTLARLEKIRLLEEKVAEAMLFSARSSAASAALHLGALEQHEIRMQVDILQGVLAGDTVSTHLSTLALERAREARPRLRKNAEDEERAHQAMKLLYLAARRDHALLETLLAAEEKQKRFLAERREQQVLDELYQRQQSRRFGVRH